MKGKEALIRELKAAAEKAARKARKGLWKDKNPINPYEFRKQSR